MNATISDNTFTLSNVNIEVYPHLVDKCKVNNMETLIELIMECNAFKNWFKTITSRNDLTINKISISDIDMFGKRIGFLTLVSDVVDSNGDKLPGICKLRGPSVGVLFFVYMTQTKSFKLLLVKQQRIPIGGVKLLEIPAGMLDDLGNFSGQAAKELKEETGITLTTNDFVSLTPKPLFMSPGGIDEELYLYFYCCKETDLGESYLEKVKNAHVFGDKEENEKTIVKLSDLGNICQNITDVKTIVGLPLLNVHKTEIIAKFPDMERYFLQTNINESSNDNKSTMVCWNWG